MRQRIHAVLFAVLLLVPSVGSTVVVEMGEPDGSQLVTIELEDVSLAEALGALAERAGKRLAVEAGVSLEVRVTLQAKEAPWREVLEQLVHVSGLAYEESGDWLIVTSGR